MDGCTSFRIESAKIHETWRGVEDASDTDSDVEECQIKKLIKKYS